MTKAGVAGWDAIVAFCRGPTSPDVFQVYTDYQVRSRSQSMPVHFHNHFHSHTPSTICLVRLTVTGGGVPHGSRWLDGIVSNAMASGPVEGHSEVDRVGYERRVGRQSEHGRRLLPYRLPGRDSCSAAGERLTCVSGACCALILACCARILSFRLSAPHACTLTLAFARACALAPCLPSLHLLSTLDVASAPSTSLDRFSLVAPFALAARLSSQPALWQ